MTGTWRWPKLNSRQAIGWRPRTTTSTPPSPPLTFHGAHHFRVFQPTRWKRGRAADITPMADQIAAELEVAPWWPGHPFKCVQRLYNRARALVITPEEAFTGLLHQLANNAYSTNRFPKVEKGDSLPAQLKKKAWGIRHKTQGGISCLAIESKKFAGLVHPPEYADRLRKLLADGQYIVPGKEGRHVRQIKVQGFGSTEKPYFVCVRLDRLPEQEP